MSYPFLTRLTEKYPVGLLTILLLTVVSSVYIVARPEPQEEGRVMWTFIRDHVPVYEEIVAEQGLEGTEHVHIELIEFDALARRVMSGFFAGTPLADLIEIERTLASRAWRGPIEAVGFVDLTDRIREDGLDKIINPPSLSPWTTRGRIFGLPQDVHPVLLCYRADIFEAAGIDVGTLDTWDKFFEATQVLVQDLDGDGRPDQYPFELPEAEGATVTTLLLQAGGGCFDLQDRPVLNQERNIEVLARLADWASGPDQVTTDMELFTGAGHALRARGYVLSWITPDWRSRQMEQYLPTLEGKLKMMPLPAWEPGGRRTSCWGGTMLGFPKVAGNFKANWEFAKKLYLSPDLAVQNWEEFRIITPVTSFWDHPVYDQPNAYYSGQPIGRMYVDQGPHVPRRTSSPYYSVAMTEVGNALNSLIRYARANDTRDPAQLLAKSRELLDSAQARVERQIRRNVFIDTQGGGE